METQIEIPALKFIHQGIERTLVKHPAYVRALKNGAMTPDDFKFKPWTLRLELQGRERKFKLSNVDKDAIRGAKDILNGQRDRPTEFAAWLSERGAKRTITLNLLVKEWRELKSPDHNGRPRSPECIANIERFLGSALKWWGEIPAGLVETKFAEFIAWRRAHSIRGTGERIADLELNVLGCLCRWAVFAHKIETNPFRGTKQGGSRPRFHSPEDVTHCHESMPASDEEFHRLLTWFFRSEDKRQIITGAWLAWCALVGLRPGEPRFLRRLSALAVIPASPKQLAPGAVFPTQDGQSKMKVQRFKGGQNPYVQLHPAAATFLTTWNAWLDANIAGRTWLFPDPRDPSLPLTDGIDGLLNNLLEHACTACQITFCKPHGFGRAYYVRVRRSQGAEDSTIANEIGQTSNGKLIRNTYGDPEDMSGGALFDWLPELDRQPIAPAWDLLAPAAQPSNIIAVHP